MPESVSVPIQSIAKTIELFIRFCVADKLVFCPATRQNHLNNDGTSRYFVIPVMWLIVIFDQALLQQHYSDKT